MLFVKSWWSSTIAIISHQSHTTSVELVMTTMAMSNEYLGLVARNRFLFRFVTTRRPTTRYNFQWKNAYGIWLHSNVITCSHFTVFLCVWFQHQHVQSAAVALVSLVEFAFSSRFSVRVRWILHCWAVAFTQSLNCTGHQRAMSLSDTDCNCLNAFECIVGQQQMSARSCSFHFVPHCNLSTTFLDGWVFRNEEWYTPKLPQMQFTILQKNTKTKSIIVNGETDATYGYAGAVASPWSSLGEVRWNCDFTMKFSIRWERRLRR